MEDIDKEIALFKGSLQKSTDATIKTREFGDQVLEPFSSYFVEKIDQFSGLFSSTYTDTSSTVREANNQISKIYFRSNRRENWPENVVSISTRFTSELMDFQGTQDSFYFRIENTSDASRCLWEFSADMGRRKPIYKHQYMGRDLELLKKVLNEMIRSMMKNLSRNPEDREVAG